MDPQNIFLLFSRQTTQETGQDETVDTNNVYSYNIRYYAKGSKY
jgi:hypothetical protein